MTDPIPESLRALDALERFEFEENAGQCAPGTTDFFTWLAHIKGASGPYCNESDAAVLELLYNASEGPDWTNSGGWLDTPVLKDWHGVEANPLGRVVALDLTANGLVGRSYVICHRPPGPLRMQWGKASELASRCCSVAASFRYGTIRRALMAGNGRSCSPD
ncbi:hypothetical protein [Candidatus Palauibacter sp.]|uniref:hypothetical protein n=1 Tax=Candidatus Palauibacter sp. TaxID=3101350 RepID=UPI003B012BA1